MIRVFIADDHDIVRDGVRRILESFRDMEVVGEAGTGRETLDKCKTLGFDVLLLDLDMPDLGGLEVLCRIRAMRPGAAILILTMHDNEEYAKRALREGAAGFILKGSAPGELPAAVRKVAEGKNYISPCIMEKITMQQCSPGGESPLSELSTRELQILSCLARYMKIREIAEELNLSASAVSTYKTRIKNKLNIRENAELMRFADKHGLAKIKL
jgi:DNA-binding NarL/FixJ family response regulator